MASPPLGVYYVRVRAVNACGTGLVSNEVAITLDGSVAVPNPPTGLTAVVSGGAASFTWTPPTSGGTPLGYHLEAGVAPGAVNGVATTTTPAFVVPAAPRGTYYVRVRAYNAAGVSSATSDVMIVVP